MTGYEDLSASDRAELDAAVRDAYRAEDGTVRTTAEAAEHFERFVASATQAGRGYIHELLDGWRRDGITTFIRRRWGSLKVDMRDPVSGEVVQRPANRGRKIIGQGGEPQWVADELEFWDAESLRAGIREARTRIQTERITIANYEALLQLLDDHPGCQFVHEALAILGKSLAEYLADQVGGA